MREVFRPYFPAFEEFVAVSFSKFWFLGNFFSRQIGKKTLRQFLEVCGPANARIFGCNWEK